MFYNKDNNPKTKIQIFIVVTLVYILLFGLLRSIIIDNIYLGYFKQYLPLVFVIDVGTFLYFDSQEEVKQVEYQDIKYTEKDTEKDSEKESEKESEKDSEKESEKDTDSEYGHESENTSFEFNIKKDSDHNFEIIDDSTIKDSEFIDSENVININNTSIELEPEVIHEQSEQAEVEVETEVEAEPVVETIQEQPVEPEKQVEPAPEPEQEPEQEPEIIIKEPVKKQPRKKISLKTK